MLESFFAGRGITRISSRLTIYLLCAGVSIAHATPPAVPSSATNINPPPYTQVVNLAAKDAQTPTQCLIAAPESDKLLMGPCTTSPDEAQLAQWTARVGRNGYLLVNGYRPEGLDERCLVNVGWEPRMGRCDESRSESFWIARDGQPGYLRLQNSYSTEERCLQADGNTVALKTCSEAPNASALWSAELLPPDPVYRQDQPDKFPQPRTLTLSSQPSATSERDRVRQNMLWTDWQPTGYYLNSHSELTVDVTGNTGDATLELVIGTPALVLASDPSRHEPAPIFKRLKPGRNAIYSPRSGMLSIRYVTDSIDKQAPNVTVTLGTNAEPVPFFVEGTTSNTQWRTMLEVSKVPVVALSGRRILLASTLETARKTPNKDAASTIASYNQGIEAQDAIAGLDESTPENQPSPLRPLVVETSSTSLPSSSNYAAMIPYKAVSILDADAVRRDWAIWHELGHQRQSPVWNWDHPSLGEVTVNIYTLAALRRWHSDCTLPVPTGGPSPVDWDKAQIYLSSPTTDRTFEDLGKTESLIRQVMFEQMRVAFGDSFYPKFEQSFRAMHDIVEPNHRKSLFQITASVVAQLDLTQYFIDWGLKPDPLTRTVISLLNLPKPEKDIAKMPVFGGSNADRLLDLWAWRMSENKIMVDGHAYPPGATIEVLNEQGEWVDIGHADQQLQFKNKDLDDHYLADGKQTLKARVAGIVNSIREAKVVGMLPTVQKLAARRTPEGKIAIRGEGGPAGTDIEAHNANSSWPGVAHIDGNGHFESDHLDDHNLVDGKQLEVRPSFQGRLGDTYITPVAQVFDVAGKFDADGFVKVSGHAAPANAFIQVLTANQQWVLVGAVKKDGSLRVDQRLSTEHLRDGKQTLEVRLLMPGNLPTQSMQAKVEVADQ